MSTQEKERKEEEKRMKGWFKCGAETSSFIARQAI